jgi:hypothetical protein
MNTLVWAFQPLPELKGATGFVECEEDLAEKLIKSGKAQDPRIGALAFKDIVAAPPPAPPKAEYDTKVMTPKPTRSK